MQDEILKNFDQHIFYHGTFLDSVKKITKEGFREADGCLGKGVYITCNWLIAAWTIYHWAKYGGRQDSNGIILRVNLSKGTRILNSSLKIDQRCIQYLRREFGKEILEKHPRKVIPHNKRLTQKEFINLFRYHYWNSWQKDRRRNSDPATFYLSSYFFWQGAKKRAKRCEFHAKLCYSLASDLRNQWQFDGFGNPEDEFGIVVFDGHHLEVKEIIFEQNWVSWDNMDLDFFDDWLDPKSNLRKRFPDVDHLRKYFQEHGSKEAKELTKQIATAAKKKP